MYLLSSRESNVQIMLTRWTLTFFLFWSMTSFWTGAGSGCIENTNGNQNFHKCLVISALEYRWSRPGWSRTAVGYLVRWSRPVCCDLARWSRPVGPRLAWPPYPSNRTHWRQAAGRFCPVISPGYLAWLSRTLKDVITTVILAYV